VERPSLGADTFEDARRRVDRLNPRTHSTSRTSMKRFAIDAVSGIALLMILAAADPARGATDRSPGLIYGEGFSFLVAPPEGWVLDNRAGVDQGLQAVFYPEGKSWKNSPAVMYVNTGQRTQGETLDQFIAGEIADFKKECGPNASVEPRPALALEAGATAPVRWFTGDRWGNREAVAYIDAPNVFVLIVLTARKQADFEAALPAFRSLVASWHFVSGAKGVVFASALETAKNNERTPAGASYDGDFGKQFGRFAGVLGQCTRDAPADTIPFDLVARIGPGGAVEDVMVRPETAVATCLSAKVRGVSFSPPPEPGWWVQVHMEIR
jgi:hypothetical protein